MKWVPIITGTVALLYWSCGPKIKTERYPDGQPKTRYQYYINQANEFIKHGPYTSYHANGEPKEKGSYKENVKDGNIVSYFEDGTKKSQEIYRAGKLHGPFTDYFSNGSKRTEGNYKNGQFHATYTKYYTNGQIE